MRLLFLKSKIDLSALLLKILTFLKNSKLTPKKIKRKARHHLERIRNREMIERNEKARQDMCWLAHKVPDECLIDLAERFH